MSLESALRKMHILLARQPQHLCQSVRVLYKRLSVYQWIVQIAGFHPIYILDYALSEALVTSHQLFSNAHKIYILSIYLDHSSERPKKIEKKNNGDNRGARRRSSKKRAAWCSISSF